MLRVLMCFASLLLVSAAYASGPADRVPTNPKDITSARQPSTGALKVTDVLDTVRLGGATWSPDGKQIGYISNASGRYNLWLMQADGSGQHQLLKSDDRQSEPVFTRDGTQILYAQDRGGDEMYDLYAAPVAGGTQRNLTHTDTTSETHPLLSPDGKWISFDSKEKTSPSQNIGVMNLASGARRLLTHESNPKASWTAVAWSPDGKWIYANRVVGVEDADIYRINLATGAAEKLTSHTARELVTASDLSPDGKTLLITSDAKGGYANVALLDVATKLRRWVTDTQWDASSGEFSPKGDTFTYLLNADGRAAIRFVNTATLATSDRGLPPGLNADGASPRSFRADGSFLFSHQDSTHAPDLYLLGAHDDIRQITHNASRGLAGAVLPGSQLIAYKSFDGRLISAFLWVPFGLKRDGTAPAVVMPHGGPTGQTLDTFNPRALLLVSRGFVVIAPNVRGSTGYGMEFQKANYQDLGGGDLKDEVAGVNFVTATGYVNPKRVGIWGGSYGGFMTLMAIGRTPALWSAAVDEYGILDWYTMLQHEDPLLQEYEKSLLGDPVKDKAAYEAASPLKYIRNEHAPLLVLQGDRDIRVPKEEAEQVVSILKSEGRTVDAVYYPEEGHGFEKREDQIDELTRAVGWLERYLKPENGSAAPAAGAAGGKAQPLH